MDQFGRPEVLRLTSEVGGRRTSMTCFWGTWRIVARWKCCTPGSVWPPRQPSVWAPLDTTSGAAKLIAPEAAKPIGFGAAKVVGPGERQAAPRARQGAAAPRRRRPGRVRVGGQEDEHQSCRVALSPMQQSSNPPGLRPGPRRGAHREGAAVTTRSAGNYRIRRPDNVGTGRLRTGRADGASRGRREASGRARSRSTDALEPHRTGSRPTTTPNQARPPSPIST